MLINVVTVFPFFCLLFIFTIITIYGIAWGLKKHTKFTLLLMFGITNAFSIYMFSNTKPTFLYGEKHRAEGINSINGTLVEIKNPDTKELYEINFSEMEMAIGHKIRVFYDVPVDQKEYITYRENFMAYGDVEFHRYEED